MPFDASQLSQENILRDVHDTANQSLRVSAFSVPPPGGVEVVISHVDDSIKVGDGTDILAVNADGSINTVVTAADLDIRDLDASQDNVAISDGTNVLAINPDGSVSVVESGVLVNTYNEVLAVASGVLTTITSFTATQSSKLRQVDVSGENIAAYEVLVNGSIVSKKRTYFGGNLDHTFTFDKGIDFNIGQQVVVKVLHNRPTSGNFNANIIILEV